MAPAQTPEAGVDQGNDRIEVGAGDRPEDEDEGEEASGRSGRVLKQLEADIVG